MPARREQLARSAAQRSPAPGPAGDPPAPRPRTRRPGRGARTPSGAGGGRDGTPAPRARRGGGPRFLDNRARAQPFLWAGGGEVAKGPPRGGGRGPGAPPRLGSLGPASRGPRLPCIPAPGHSPRSEKKGCRPPWPRRRRAESEGDGPAAAAPPRPRRPASLPRPRRPGPRDPAARGALGGRTPDGAGRRRARGAGRAGRA